jgi:hypothetical protein
MGDNWDCVIRRDENIIGAMRSKLGLAVVFFCASGSLLSACDSAPTKTTGIVGSYAVQISAMGKSDPDILTITPGADHTLLFTFVAGISTDPMGTNANGLRVLLDGTSVNIQPQSCHIDHSTGSLDGSITGSGTIAADGSMISVMLHYAPTNLAFKGPDGNALQIPDGGTVPTLDYDLEGAKQ